jgi:hypothetical protein
MTNVDAVKVYHQCIILALPHWCFFHDYRWDELMAWWQVIWRGGSQLLSSDHPIDLCPRVFDHCYHCFLLLHPNFTYHYYWAIGITHMYVHSLYASVELEISHLAVQLLFLILYIHPLCCACELVEHYFIGLLCSRPFSLGGRWLGHWLAVAALWVSHWLPHRIFAQGPVHSLRGIAGSLPPT